MNATASKSGVTGVSWSNACQKWSAHLQVNGKHIHLGVFDTVSDAVMARREAEKRYGISKKLSVSERFHSHTDKNAGDGCWLWLAAKYPSGYGQCYHEGRVQPAHRVSWKLFRGEIPEGMVICHKCDNPACVNPEHLFVGTQQDNLHDMCIKNRARKGISGVTGVRWNSRARKWEATISEKRVKKWLGAFSNFAEAVAVRKTAEAERFGRTIVEVS